MHTNGYFASAVTTNLTPPCPVHSQFFNVIVMPLYASLAAVLPAVEPLLAQVRMNHAGWVADMTAGFVNAKPTVQ